MTAHLTGVRRILNHAADRALAAGPPTKAHVGTDVG